MPDGTQRIILAADDFTLSEDSVSFETAFMDAASNIGVRLLIIHFQNIINRFVFNLAGP
jgi:hypothetical protein